MTDRPDFDFETQVLGRLERLQDDVDSLHRSIRGASDEGNLGLLVRVMELELHVERRADQVDERIDLINVKLGKAVAWAAGAGAGAGVVGAILTALLDLDGLLSP